MQVEFILYVKDQVRSRGFYRTLLGMEPVLDVPGMTEFDLGGCKLGLMPENGIARIITPALPNPKTGSGIPRCELYLLVVDLTPPNFERDPQEPWSWTQRRTVTGATV